MTHRPLLLVALVTVLLTFPSAGAAQDCSNDRSFVSGLKELYESQGLDLITGRYSCREGLLWLRVSSTWYSLNCGIKRQTYVAIRDAWRGQGGSNLILRDVVGTIVAEFRVVRSNPKILDCDQMGV